MAATRGHEIPTIDVSLVTITVAGQEDEIMLNTANQVAVTPQITTTEAIKLIIKNRLIAQKPQQDTLTGNQIVLTDNVFNPELVTILQGGTVTYDSTDTTKLIGYAPPVAGSTDRGEIFVLNIYSAVYDEAGIIVEYEKVSWPNCRGVPFSPSAQDDTFRISEFTINSAPSTNQSPYTVSYVAPADLPIIPAQLPNGFPAEDPDA